MAGGQERSNDHDQQDAFRIVDMQKICGRENEQEPYRIPGFRLGTIKRDQAAKQDRERERRGGGDEEGTIENIAHYERGQMSEYRIERIKNQQQRRITSGLIAVARDIEIVRAIPAVP